MEFVSIFGQNGNLFTVKYPDEETHEFKKLFDMWMDASFLYEYFSKHEKDLKDPFWGGISIEDAVLKAIDEAIDFRKMLIAIEKGKRWKNITTLAQIFRPLSEGDTNSRLQGQKKGKPYTAIPFLRLYALQLEDDKYIITGGGIKLTEKMQGSEYLKRELKKLNRVKDYLKEQGIFTVDDLESN